MEYGDLLKSLTQKLTLEELSVLNDHIANEDLSYDINDFIDRQRTKQTIELAKPEVIGLTLEQVKEKFPSIRTRVTSVDGEGRMVTCDWAFNRLNLDLVDGKVVGCHLG